MKRETPNYDRVMAEAEYTIHTLIEKHIPELCRATQDEYDAMDHGYTDEYGDPDNDRESESYKYLRNEYVKIRVMMDMQGELFQDKVYNRHGIRLLPKKAEKKFGYLDDYHGSKKGFTPMERWNRVTELWEPMSSFNPKIDKGIIKGYYYTKPKDMSPMAKFTEQVIDQEINRWTKK